MRIILLQDVENLGKKYDVKEVADGYARNFLIPKKLAKLGTKKALEALEKQKEIIAKEAEKELKTTQAVISQFEGQEIELTAKLKKDGTIYGSITEAKLKEALKKKGLDIKKAKVKVKAPIEKAGEHSITIVFDHGLEAEVKVIVIEEKKKPATSPKDK